MTHAIIPGAEPYSATGDARGALVLHGFTGNPQSMRGLALALGALTVLGVVRLWQVYVFAFLFGCASAFDAPVRQTFVAELVGDEDLHNAVALNSTSFNAARMIGPAVSGPTLAPVYTNPTAPGTYTYPGGFTTTMPYWLALMP